MAGIHPREALFDPGEPASTPLPVCDHYAGVEARMRKSLELQGEVGPGLDVPLDADDGAPDRAEQDHGALMAELRNSPLSRHGRVGARLVPVDHPAFETLVEAVVGGAGPRLAYVMVPKVRGLVDLQRA